jgi:predicted MFS family arabinose efflux permease
MAPLALVFVGHAATGSFAAGAVMASAYTFSEALSAPACGRLLGRAVDLRRGLVVSLAGAVLVLAGLGVAGALGLPAVVLILLSGAAGAVPSAVPGGLRALLQHLVPDELAEAAFALDATLLEIEYMGGPAIVGLISLAGAPVVAVPVMALASLVALALVRALPSQPTARRAGDTDTGSPWRARAAWGSYGASLLLGYAEGTVTLALAPLLVHIGAAAADAGFLLAGLSAASAVGGFGYGWLASRLGQPSSARAPLLLAVIGLLLVPIATSTSLGVMAVAVAGFGVLIAPINALRTYQLGRALPAHQHAEGFSVLYGAMGVGFGISGLVSAAILHTVGPRAPLMVAAGIVTTVGGVSAVTSLLRTGWRRR